MKFVKKMQKCPECGSNQFIQDETRGELRCAKCGTIIKEYMVDRGQEWRAFDSEQISKRARTGAPLTFTKHDKGLTTEIGNLPKPVHERIARYYEDAVDKGLVRGRSIESVIAALVYAVSRQFGTPRTLDEIAEASGLEKREIGRTYRYVARELQIRILPANPKDYVPRFCSILNLSDKVQANAIKILKRAKKMDITSGKGPTGVAAAAIYIACVLTGEKRTQREVASIVNVTEVTIRNRYKELVEKLGLEKEVEEKTRED